MAYTRMALEPFGYAFSPTGTKDLKHLGSMYGQDLFFDDQANRIIDRQTEQLLQEKESHIMFLQQELLNRSEVKRAQSKNLDKENKLKNLIAYYYQRK